MDMITTGFYFQNTPQEQPEAHDGTTDMKLHQVLVASYLFKFLMFSQKLLRKNAKTVKLVTVIGDHTKIWYTITQTLTHMVNGVTYGGGAT